MQVKINSVASTADNGASPRLLNYDHDSFQYEIYNTHEIVLTVWSQNKLSPEQIKSHIENIIESAPEPIFTSELVKHHQE